eukprot:CAMPEP_0171787238 /NCGR_PEP_ID=MMETSP0991-20121206/63791_1 /TAXON_ID=483369 /ORGANISM="non described non described, Strain CCMP2098" /LENGTH=53 /DNA_ID=CAMNT_0012396171 /DNA_START=127 /DNA_END=284 /DNA_ORIENTATION=+
MPNKASNSNEAFANVVVVAVVVVMSASRAAAVAECAILASSPVIASTSFATTP